MTRVVGTNARRADGDDKVRGAAVYGMDYGQTGTLQAKLLRSPVPAGRIRRLDTARAAALPGVRAIITAADVPDTTSGWILKDQPMFAREEVRYIGEPIAAVAADTLAQAEAAVAAIELEIDPLEALTDMDAALAEGARLIHPAWESYQMLAPGPRSGNVAWESTLDRGDVDAAFAAAHLVVEDEFSTQRQHQSPIEPHAAVGRFEGGRYVVHSPAQFPFLVRDRLAEWLGIAPSKVRVVVTTIGGGFGGKIDAMLEPFVCVLARRTGRAVRLVNTRAEELQTAGPRENAKIRIRTAVSANGEILAQEADTIADNGAYSGEIVACAAVPGLVFGGTYRVPVARYRTRVVYTNTAPTAAFRGVNGPYAMFALEQHLDHIAAKLGMDRRELRLRNVVKAGEAIANGQVLDDAVFEEGFAKVEQIAPWAAQAPSGNPRGLRGKGIGAVTWLTNPGPGGATVKINEDGTAGVICAGAEIGTGAVAAGLRQIVAEELGLTPDDVIILAADTDAGTYDGGAQGSRTLFSLGNAAVQASAQVREQLLEVAANLLEANPADLELADGHVQVTGSPGAKVPLAAVAQTALYTAGPISATGRHITPPVQFDSGCLTGALFTGFATPTYHVHSAEVEVDPDTGKVTILRYVVAQDVGRAINPQQVEGQIHGGVLQGVGYALYEDLRVADGVTVDHSLENYRLPTAFEAPPIDIALLDNPWPDGPYGAKGAGEPSLIPVAAVIASAVSDAIGKPIRSLPITPFDVLAALREESESPAKGTTR
ncbi:molybdopterin cofactor-binding domain-containing protein [Pseudonocardia acidicola]|uniref:Xanthine dehydrogenase family protein n=1 Tax=Pseudonocardia acidicola TaxID=2724939 RepID=A0ABX1S7D8_9PSEU|nr:xanthine dehydrogenase family protein [Pseudonocardia acidicola]